MSTRRGSPTQVASSTPFDNSTNGFVADESQSAIEEVKQALETSASPGFTWGKSGNVANNTWLLNDTVPSNKSGRAVFLSAPTLERIFVRCEIASTFDLSVYEHDGATFTLITTVSVSSSRVGDYSIASLPLTSGKDLAVLLTNGSARNVVCGCILKGTL